MKTKVSMASIDLKLAFLKSAADFVTDEAGPWTSWFINTSMRPNMTEDIRVALIWNQRHFQTPC